MGDFFLSGRIYDVFKGIPFGDAPVGDKRWKKPDPPVSWDGVLQADQFKANCHQLIGPVYPIIGVSGETSEDCLYLNIYVPGGVDV